MSFCRRLASGVAMGAFVPWAHAADQTPVHPVSGPSLAPLVMGMVLVLALIPIAVWLLRRTGLAQGASGYGIRVVAQLSLGPRDRLVVVQVADRRWLLGVSASGIRRLGTLPAGSDGDPPADGGPAPRGFADVLRLLGRPK